jgi:CRISPR-associated protein Cmr4
VSEYSFVEVLYHCITPLHVGCGQDVGIVDLPVIRERTTGWPFIPGSGIRGSLRDRFESRGGTAMAMTSRLLGSDDGGDISSGCVSILDARLLLFPVRSAPGPFRWITCPYALQRYRTDLDFFTGTPVPAWAPPGLTESQYSSSAGAMLALEEFPFSRLAEATTWQTALPTPFPGWVDGARVVLVTDDVFFYFVQHATIVAQHNRLTSAKTVVKGGLFSVESVPSEAVFYGFLGSTEERCKGNGALNKSQVTAELKKLTLGEAPGSSEAHLILGGDESTGLGVTRLVWRS